jgi:hypothetical protein
MKRIELVVAMLTVAMFAFQGVSYAQHDHKTSQEKSSPNGLQVKESYTCPMHPDIVSDKPGKCPKCDMTLERRELSTADRQEKMSAMMGKPTFEKPVEGVQVRVWLITQDEHKKMMGTMMQDKKDSSVGGGMMHGEMKHDMSTMDHGMMGTMMQGRKDSSMSGNMMHGEMKGMDHEKMAKGMKRDMNDDEHNNKMETMMAGTHHVMVTLTDEKSNQPVEKAKVAIEFIAPSEKSGIVVLSSMMSHFGGGLTLDEKGTYMIEVTFQSDNEVKHARFTYDGH